MVSIEEKFPDGRYVLPEPRGQGATDALFQALENHAHSKGWPAIRWLTQSFNKRGRKFYDRYTDGPSNFIMYHWNQNER